MSKTTIILTIIAIISLTVLACIGYWVNNQSVDESPQMNSVATSSNQTDDEELNETATNSTTVNIDKTLNFFIADESQESTDFDSEAADKSQIKVESQDILNLSQSYETSDL